MKKITKLLLVIALFFCINVNADNLTINNANMEEGEVYKAYQMTSYAGDGDYLTSDWIDFYLNGYGANVLTIEKNTNMFINFNENFDVNDIENLEEFAKQAKSYVESITPAWIQKFGYDRYNATTNSITMDLNPGFYLIISPRGNKPAIVYVKGDKEINEKNVFISKMEMYALKNGEQVKTISAEYGKYVDFVVKADLNSGLNNVSLKLSGEIKVNPESISIEGVDSKYYTVNYDSNKEELTIEFTKEYLDSIEENASLEIKFNGSLLNEYSKTQYLSLDYTINQASKNDHVVVQTWSSKIHTYYNEDGSKGSILGATYTLSRDKEGKDLVKFVELYDGYEYRLATEDDENTTTLLSGHTAIYVIRGLSDGTYYLHQQTVPFGFAKRTDAMALKVDLVDNGDGTLTYGTNEEFGVEVQKINSVMPFTGGAGTKALISIGLVLFITSLSLIITKLRNNDNN